MQGLVFHALASLGTTHLLETPPPPAAHGLQGLQGFLAAQGLQGFFFAAHGLQGLQGFLAAHGLQGFFAAHGFLAPHGLHGFLAPHGLQGFLAPHGLHGLQAARRMPAGLFLATGNDLMALDAGLTASAGPELVIVPATTMPVPKSTGMIVLDSSLDLNAFTVEFSPKANVAVAGLNFRWKSCPHATLATVAEFSPASQSHTFKWP
ncbi:MAG: hypothetical protein QGI06_03630 [Rhodospirillales bacterium]|nr:hypothetical protein [Rhodospirillales bacterium]